MRALVMEVCCILRLGSLFFFAAADEFGVGGEVFGRGLVAVLVDFAVFVEAEFVELDEGVAVDEPVGGGASGDGVAVLHEAYGPEHYV